ncbi:MAG TPA: hypothetical protein VED18_00140 [Candidatus Sulfotelmatobacter sp.]|nr:hypothetical protein [Candidatus Sulfotelmatobacter sp.]
MKRTQISFAQREYEFVRREAKRRGMSMAAVVRELVQERMAADRRVPADHPFRDIIGLGHGDGSPVSEKHDEYLYSLPARRR